MTSALLKRLRDVVTVHTRSPQIDPLSASRLVLLALPGVDPAAVEAFLEAREQLSPQDRSARQLAMSLLRGAERYLSRSRSRVYTVRAEARSPGGAVAYRQAVVRTTSNPRKPYIVLAWSDASSPVVAHSP